MPKRTTKKKNSGKVLGTEKILIENFVALQKVMTNLSFKFDALSNQISKLLEIFEISAKSLAGKEFSPEKNQEDISKKLDTLSEQNKILARGVALMHEKSSPIQQQYPSQNAYQGREQFSKSAKLNASQE